MNDSKEERRQVVCGEEGWFAWQAWLQDAEQCVECPANRKKECRQAFEERLTEEFEGLAKIFCQGFLGGA
jgi:hypothetical protein